MKLNLNDIAKKYTDANGVVDNDKVNEEVNDLIMKFGSSQFNNGVEKASKKADEVKEPTKSDVPKENKEYAKIMEQLENMNKKYSELENNIKADKTNSLKQDFIKKAKKLGVADDVINDIADNYNAEKLSTINLNLYARTGQDDLGSDGVDDEQTKLQIKEEEEAKRLFDLASKI